jgi:hypothetical protein
MDLPDHIDTLTGRVIQPEETDWYVEDVRHFGVQRTQDSHKIEWTSQGSTERVQRPQPRIHALGWVNQWPRQHR